MKKPLFLLFMLTTCSIQIIGQNSSTEQVDKKFNPLFQKEITTVEQKTFDAPPIIDSNYISSKTTYFTVKNDKIYGEGSETLIQIFKESQFVVFGERHNSKETSNLVAALIPVMSDHSFKNICLEIGPHSATKLKELMIPYQSTLENLKAFNTKYYHKNEDGITIPFFGGIEDAKFLQNVSKFNMNIWGLDQEYFYSVLYLTDELLSEAKNLEDFPAIQSLKQKTDEVIHKWFLKEKESEEEIDVFSEILKDADV